MQKSGNMRAIIIILLCMTSCSGLLAQNIIATAGSTLSNSNGSISFTIGESVANTLIKGDRTITQGFHQTNISVSLVSELKDIDFMISVFPNPAYDFLTISLNTDKVDGFQYLLFDINGKLLAQKKLESNETSVSVEGLPSGVYLIKIREGLKELKTFKIVKQ